MLIAKEANLPLNLMNEREDTESNHEISDAKCVRNLENNLREIHQLAREIMKNNSNRQKRNFDKNIRELSYEVGDLVRRSQPKIVEGTKQKLARKWTGPWIVTRRLSDVLSQIKHAKKKPLLFMPTTLNDTMAVKRYQV